MLSITGVAGDVSIDNGGSFTGFFGEVDFPCVCCLTVCRMLAGIVWDCPISSLYKLEDILSIM